ncbi:GATA transcription factor 21-like [Lycium barbarum]|uniref:GATA transcription factor 21-like n=1 Tax=Lycium barbarum TaxID=112863 RepID=UPI00293F5DEF|nr:GATA transcription factor 21-like [Lycium barbarum]
MTSPTDHINYSTPFHFGLNNNNDDHHMKYNSLVSPNYQASSTTSHSSYHHFFVNSTIDQTGNYNHHTEYYMPQHQPEVDNDGVSYDLGKKNKVRSGLKLTLWKREDKLVSSKIKDSDQARMKNTTKNTCIKLKLEDQKQKLSPPLETDYSSNSSNYIPIRVCADCNTTKTPLWRGGPKGPKSLCNACGIRQRKARRAMAEAAEAAANGKTHTTDQTSSSTMKIKIQHKEKIAKVNTNHVAPYKKRCKFSPSSSSTNAPKKIGNFEDFLINLSNNLSFHQIFPQDEKEAAILLMALSSGLVHG